MSVQETRGWRIGAAALIAAALQGAIGQVLHPASVSAVDNPAQHIAEVATSPVWLLSHLLFLLAFVINLVGLWALARLVEQGPRPELGRLAFGVAGVGSAVAIIFITIDGFAVKLMADAWAAGAPDAQPMLLQIGVAFDQLEDALFGAWLLTYFGLTGLAYGAALRTSDLPRWIGLTMLVGGTVATINGLLVLTVGISVPSFIALGPSALCFWIPLLASGVLLWRRAGRESSRASVAA